MTEQKAKSPKISMRPYKPGDEDKIIDFLNLSYNLYNAKGWGDVRLLKWMEMQYPTFEKDSLFTFEIDGQIVGHRGLFLRDLCISGSKACIGHFTNTAVHPDFRGLGIYTKLHQMTMQAARSKNASMFVSTSTGKGTITYKHNKKTGFAEIKRGAYYCKILNHERVFKSELRDFITENEKIRSLVKGLESHLYLGVGDSLFSVAEILGEEPDSAQARKRVKIIFDQSAFPLLFKFTFGGKLQKVMSLFLLLLSRKMKIRSNSLSILLKLAWKGVRIIV